MSALTVEPIVRVVQKLHVKFVFPNIMLIQMVNVHSALINAIHVLMKRNVWNAFLDLHQVPKVPA